ncbi:unnamed protein product [marine sediment metagenome]|uniref:Uncharacterized protein n=1 Tax=marine sediment metagenome TaxID=412755 RepID=X1IKQ7_9ZZZZ
MNILMQNMYYALNNKDGDSYELEKIGLIWLGEKKTVITEVSKKQRQLLEKFNIKSPDKADLVTKT